MRLIRICLTAASLVSVLGCTTPRGAAPVVERSVGGTTAVSGAASAPVAAGPVQEATAPTTASSDSAGKPGFYTVKPGDTIIRIGLDNGQNWRDIVRWNGISNPNQIEVGQVLRVLPPGVDATAATTRPVVPARAEARPLEPRSAASAAGTTATGPTATATPSVAAPAAGAIREPDDDINWLWPATGQVASGFDEGRSKGLVIVGKAGDPVLAAADGRVVYAGSGLRGYGNLVIVKHNATYLTAYAHNQTLLVKEDQAVRRGQKIAEMGATDADRVQLHFEIRRQGKPIDPARLLPVR